MSSGVKVSSGRLRVDAARAVDKLREYQLPDPTAWVLEVVRAAVAFGAEEVRVSGDGDDVRVVWEGPTPDAEALTHLFDELVDPAPRRERRPLRLLATGVNTALGMDPRWIEVSVTDGSGDATSVRYTPSVLEVQDGAAEGLRALRAEVDRASPECPSVGGLVHLRRLPSFSAVPLMIGYGEPRELAIVRASCDDSRVPVVVGRTELGRERSHGDLLRLDLGDGFDGFIALVDPAFARSKAELVVAELGVALARYTLDLDAFPVPQAAVPLRVYVDATRMPTNASRSAVRLHESPVAEAIAHARTLVPNLVARLASELGEDAEHPWAPAQASRLRAAALLLFAAHGAGSGWRGHLTSSPPSLHPVLDLPLLRDALGRPRSLSSFSVMRGAEVVHFGADEMPKELEPWLGDTLWVPPGDAASALLGDWTPKDASRLAKTAHRYRRRRSAFSEKRKRKAKLALEEDPLLVVPIKKPGRSLKSCVPPELFEVEGLRGEVAFRGGTAEAGVSMLLDGREIERWKDEAIGAFEGVATCAGLKPQLDYSGLDDNDALLALRAAVRGAMVVAYEALALRWRGSRSKGDRARAVAPWVAKAEGADGARIISMLQGGVLFAMDLLAERSSDVDVQNRRDAGRRALLESKSPLLTAAIWPKVGGGRATTADLIRQGTRKPFLVGHHPRGAAGGPAPEGRTVFELPRGMPERLQEFLPSARFVDYSPALVRPLRAASPGELARDVMEPLGVAIELEPSPGLRVAVAWGAAGPSAVSVRHWGQELASWQQPDLFPVCRVLVDDASLVPARGFQRAEAIPEYPLAAWNVDAGCAFVDVLTGGDALGLHLGPYNATDARAAQTTLLEWIAAGDGAKDVLGGSRWQRLAHVPWVRRLGQAGYTTLAEVAEDIGDGPLEWVPLSEAAAVDLGGWHPVCASEETARAFANILERETKSAVPRLAVRRRAARRQHALDRHRARDLVDPAGRWSGVRVDFKGQGIRAASATFGQGKKGASVELLIESRAFKELHIEDALPIRLVVDLPPAAADKDFAEVSALGHRRVLYAIGAGARRLLEAIADDSPTSLTGAPEVYGLLLAWCARIADAGGNAADRKTVEKLARARAFETVQGEHVSLEEAAGGTGGLRLARWGLPWLGPDGGRTLSLDRPVLRLPVVDAPEHRAMLRALFANRTQDVTAKVARLQASRRVQRGLMEAPRLAGEYDARFRYPLADLLDEVTHVDQLAVLGIGEVAFARAERSALFYTHRGQSIEVDLGVCPAIHIAAQLPDCHTANMRGAQRTRLLEVCETLISLVVRRVVDHTPSDQLPVWVRDQLLDAALEGGPLHLSRLASTPIFQTTAGTYVSPSEVFAQAERFGSVWTTASKQQLVPLDTGRFALRLDAAETAQLNPYASAIVATEELRLDAIARRNLAKPPVHSLEPGAAVASAALSITSLEATETSSAAGSVVLLQPGYESLRGIQLSRSFHPLGVLKVANLWPVACRIDDPALSPDRTWSTAADDDVRRTIVSRVAKATYAAVTELTPVPPGKLAASRVLSSTGLPLPKNTAVIGVIWLEAEVAPGRLRVSLPAGAERDRASADSSGRALPLCGELRSTLVLGQVRHRKLCVALYQRLLTQLCKVVAGRRGLRREQSMAQIAHALTLGISISPEDLARVPVEGFVGEGPSDLSELRTHLSGAGLVAICEPSDLPEAQAASLTSLLFVDDGSPIRGSLVTMMRSQAVPWRTTLLAPEPSVIIEEEPPPPRTKPRHALARAVLETWRGLPLPGMQDVRLDGRRKSPPILFSDGTKLTLSKRYPAVQRAVEALETADPSADAQIAVLVAHAAGVRRRASGNPSAGAERAMLTELMEQLARPDE